MADMQFVKELKNILRIVRIELIRILVNKQELIYPERCLIFAPHPDDEVFGCSGFIQQLLSLKKEVFIVFMTKGESSHISCCNIDKSILKEERFKLTNKALKLLGVPPNNVFRLSYSDGSVTYNSEETKILKKIIESVNPDTIFVPHDGEGWNDHIETANIAKKLVDKTNIAIYSYCVWFWFYNVWNIDWKNAFTIRLSSDQKKLKDKAINIYIEAKAPCGKPYSGILPKVFVWANKWNRELYFKLK